MPNTELKQRQVQWATSKSMAHDGKGYLSDTASNLFRPLGQSSLAEFARGSGGEMAARDGGRPAKMCALHSSSVLACNVFDYWRATDLGVVAKALGIPSAIERMEFEAQFPTGLPGNPPNLDVGFWLRSGEVWGIESKFTEPYSGKSSRRPPFKDKYFPDGQPVWTSRALTKSGELAAALQGGSKEFTYLDAPQLLKHILGLHAAKPGAFTLGYLYMRAGSGTTSEHAAEAAEFAAALAGEVPMVVMDYHEFVDRLRGAAGPGHEAYFTYLDERYLG